MLDEQVKELAVAILRQAISDQYLLDRLLVKLQDSRDKLKERHRAAQITTMLARLSTSERRLQFSRNRLRRFWRGDWAMDLSEVAGVDGAKARQLALGGRLPQRKSRGGRPTHHHSGIQHREEIDI